MCLAFPMKVIEIHGTKGVTEFHGVQKEVNLDLVPAAKVGDYVLIHSGYAINVLSPDEALETLRIYEELLDVK